MTELLNHLLAHVIPTNDGVPAAVPHLLSVLRNDRAIQRCEQEEGLGGAVMHRWNLRLMSLIQPSLLPPFRAAGFALLLPTLSSSTPSLLSQTKPLLALALNTLQSPIKADAELYVAATECVKHVLALSTWQASEWSREMVGAQMAQKIVQAWIKAAESDRPELLLSSVSAITTLLPLFPTALRPLSPALHSLAIGLVCDPSCASDVIDAGATLFGSLYLLSPKGKDGLREAWRKGVEALACSADALVGFITSDIFAEDPQTNHGLSPLALPPLPAPTPLTALARLESLLTVLMVLLRSPTSEKTGTVDVPLLALVELGIRLTGMNFEMPVKDRTDPTTLTSTRALLPRLQVAGCLLLTQLSLCVGAKLAPHSTEILQCVSGTLSTYPLRSTMRPILSTTYSLILASLGAHLDPEEGKRSLARVWRCVLEDVGSVAVEPAATVKSDDKNAGGNGRKTKRQKTYDPSEAMELGARRVRLTEEDLEIAQQGLSTLERLLQTPAAHFLPPSLRLSTTRLLLSLVLAPSFLQSHPTISTSFSDPTFFPLTSALKGVEVALSGKEWRRAVVSALKGVSEGSWGGEGVQERLAGVWRSLSTDPDLEVKSIATQALTSFQALIHPALPPLQVNTTFARLKRDRDGAALGDEDEIVDGAAEFAPRELEPQEAADGSDMVVEVSEEVTKTVEVAPPKKALAFSDVSKGFTAASFSTSSFLSKPLPTPPASAPASAPDAAPAVNELSIHEPPTFVPAKGEEPVAFSEGSTVIVGDEKGEMMGSRSGGARKQKQTEESDSDDDEAMPTINVGESDEE